MIEMTLVELLSDLRYIDPPGGIERAAWELDHNAAHLIELDWARVLGGRRLVITGEGLDVLYATRGLVLAEAA